MTDLPCSELIATCAFGVESTVRWELRHLGIEARVESPGRLCFAADAGAIVRSNLWLRAADRVLAAVGRFEAAEFDALYEGVSAVPWRDALPERAEVTVHASCVRSQIDSARSAQSIVKRAIVDSVVGRGNVMDESGPRVGVDVMILGDAVTVSLDSSGDGLHKRGYRQRSGPGQLKETLAAALVLLCRWRRDEPLVDSFCGSGTIAIEAAMLAAGIAPGLNRSFSAEAWPWIDANQWYDERERAEGAIDETGVAPIIGSDIDERAIRLARSTAKAASVPGLVRFERRDFRELESGSGRGWVITNPPYGVRVGDEPESERIHRDLATLMERMPARSFGVFTGLAGCEKLIGREANRRRKLYNARIPCTLYQFGPCVGSAD